MEIVLCMLNEQKYKMAAPQLLTTVQNVLRLILDDRRRRNSWHFDWQQMWSRELTSCHKRRRRKSRL